MGTEKTPRVRSTRIRRITAAAAILALAAVGVTMSRRLHRQRKVPLGIVWAMQAVDDGAVLVWTGRPREDGARGWVSRVDARGNTLWWSPLPDEALIGNSLAVGEGIVTVRYSHRTPPARRSEDQAVVAYALADGRVLWDRRLAMYEPRASDLGDKPTLDLYATAAFVGGRLIEWVDRGAPGSSLIVLDPRTGNVQSQMPWDDGYAETVNLGAQLLQHEVAKVHALDVATGRATQRETEGTGCLVGDEYVTFDRNEDDSASLVAFSGADLSKRRVIKAPFRPREGSSLLKQCGSYRDRIVLVLDGHSTDGSDATLVVIASRAGEVLHVISLPNDMSWDGEAIEKRYYDHASLAGELTRFVPYVYLQHSPGEDDQHEPRLVMLDLEDGTIAWQSPEDRSWLNGHLFRGTNEWYLISGFYEDIVTVLDGDTGHVGRSVMAHSYEGVTSIVPTHVRAGKLWIASGGWTPLDPAPVAILDERTLDASFTTPVIELRDMTAKQRLKLQPEAQP